MCNHHHPFPLLYLRRYPAVGDCTSLVPMFLCGDLAHGPGNEATTICDVMLSTLYADYWASTILGLHEYI